MSDLAQALTIVWTLIGASVIGVVIITIREKRNDE